MATNIGADTVEQIRFVLNQALSTALKEHGLKATIGRITYLPGSEIRCKLTVIQPASEAKKGEEPKVGEKWSYGSKIYTIDSVDNGTVRMSRYVKPKNPWDTGRRTYKSKLSAIVTGGTKVEGAPKPTLSTIKV